MSLRNSKNDRRTKNVCAQLKESVGRIVSPETFEIVLNAENTNDFNWAFGPAECGSAVVLDNNYYFHDELLLLVHSPPLPTHTPPIPLRDNFKIPVLRDSVLQAFVWFYNVILSAVGALGFCQKQQLMKSRTHSGCEKGTICATGHTSVTRRRHHHAANIYYCLCLSRAFPAHITGKSPKSANTLARAWKLINRCQFVAWPNRRGGQSRDSDTYNHVK